MLRTFLSICVVLLLGVGMESRAQEEVAIERTLRDFLEGGTNGEIDRFRNAFVPDAVQRSVAKTGQVTGMTVRDLTSRIKPNEVMDRTTRIVSWSYAGNAATAVTETEYATNKIIDLLNLLKVNGEWKIVSRVFSRIEKGESVQSSSPAPVSKAAPKNTPAAKKPAPVKKAVSDDGW